MTYRERRMRKAERLRGWAEKREVAAEATIKADEVYTSDHAFNTQPGHIPIRARVIARQDRAFESLQKAERMAERADSIEAAAEHAIYSDDKDAIERLEERIAALDAERSRIKAYNANCRKGARDVSLLDEKQQKDLLSVMKYSPYQVSDSGAAPAYWLQNLGGNINRQKKRLEQLKREKELLT